MHEETIGKGDVADLIAFSFSHRGKALFPTRFISSNGSSVVVRISRHLQITSLGRRQAKRGPARRTRFAVRTQ